MFLKVVTVLTIFGMLCSVAPVEAAMSSTNYYIYADSVDNGGLNSTSSAYSVQDTIGEATGGVTTSTSYIVRGGYQGADLGNLSMAISATSVNLGALSTAQVSSGSSDITISTDSVTGYSLSIGSVSGATLAAVVGGVVTAGTEAYGVAVAGNDASFANDQAVNAGLLLSASTTPVVSSLTTLTFKASISGASTPGSYNQTVTLTASANL